jgi:putative transposase
MSATCERLVGTLRRERLDHVLILDERHLRAVLTDYQRTTTPHGPTRASRNTSHDERDVPRATVTDVDTQQIRRKPVLNGLINEYMHAA